MPSSYTDLGFELQAAGENTNTWGAPRLNAALSRINYAIAGYISGECCIIKQTSKTLCSRQQMHNPFKRILCGHKFSMFRSKQRLSSVN